MPHNLPLLDDLLILLVASIPIAFFCHRLRLPVIVGFMLTGVVIGPYGLGLIKDAQAVEALAEIGVVLLLFTIGLEFSLRRMMEMKRLVSLGAAWLTSRFGLSMALGAFIAGIVLAESEYSHQIVSDVMPFRDVFNSIFFISIGMLLSLGSLSADLLVALGWFGALVLGKAVVVLAVARLLGNSLRVAAMVGIGLAQVGEFSFILAKVGLGQGLLSEGDYQRFLAASILSMIATPFLIKAAPRVGYALQAKLSRRSSLDPMVDDLGEDGHGLNRHVVVVGYGMNGRNLTKVLHRVGIPYVVLELNAEVVRGARAQGAPIEYGDAGRKEALQHVGVRRAEIMVVAISDPVSTHRAVALARELNPGLCIIVRTRYMSEVDELYRLGADQVIPEEFETSVEIFSRVLREYGVSRNVIQREVEEIRSEGYQMLRSASLPPAELDRIAEAFGSTATDAIFIGSNSPAIGKTLKELDLRNQTGASVTAAIRDGNTQINLGPEFRIEQDDILVLIGMTEQLEKAVERIRAAGGNGEGDLEDRASAIAPSSF